MSAIAHLRTETWASHQRLEKRVDVKARFASRAAYRDHLVKLWGFYGALESQLGREVFADALADYEARRKVPLLTRDLLALGLAPEVIDQLPRCLSVPACADTAAAFGCVYVLEGATLGGRTLLPLAASRLGLSPSEGAAYLSSYGEAVTTMWRSFGSALDAWCALPERRDRAAAAAIATFDSLDTWLCE
jgi:heme oxygenase (biliverdin-IX-beta and delta-forming)